MSSTRLACFTLIGLLSAAPLGWAGATVDGANFSLLVENDSGSDTDGHYTNGLKARWQ